MADHTHGVIADFCLVIADSIRNPVFARHWMTDAKSGMTAVAHWMTDAKSGMKDSGIEST